MRAGRRREWAVKRSRIFNRRAAIRLAVFVALVLALGLWGHACMIEMPGESYDGPMPELDEAQAALAERLRRDVAALAEGIGERNVEHPEQPEAAARLDVKVVQVSRHFHG